VWMEYTLGETQFKSLKTIAGKATLLEDKARLLLTKLSVLDSIDGRLLEAGYLMLWLPLSGRAGQLIIRDAKRFVRLVELPLKAQPNVPSDLPPHLLGGSIDEALSARALVALTRVSASVQTSALRIKGKIVADVTVVKAKDAATAALWVDGRRGFEGQISKVFSAMTPAGRKASLIKALAGDAAAAAALNAKGFPTLARKDSTAGALRTLHETLLAQMLSQVDGTQADTDIEFLHDLRVASRRARSLLQTMRGHLNSDNQAYAVDTYKWIGQQTTDLRDLDVYLADFPSLEKAVSVELSGALEPFKKALKKQRVTALRRVRTMLKSKRFMTFKTEWAQRLQAGDAFLPEAQEKPIYETASKAIWKRYRRICRDGAKITPDTPAEALHDLRKEGKKLRYLLEFFASLYPEDVVKPRIAQLKKLQDLLGAYQDCAVQAEFLESKAALLRQDMNVPAETLMAMGALADQRLQDEKKIRKDFEAFFAPFSSAAEQKNYKAMTARK